VKSLFLTSAPVTRVPAIFFSINKGLSQGVAWTAVKTQPETCGLRLSLTARSIWSSCIYSCDESQNPNDLLVYSATYWPNPSFPIRSDPNIPNGTPSRWQANSFKLARIAGDGQILSQQDNFSLYGRLFGKSYPVGTRSDLFAGH